MSRDTGGPTGEVDEESASIGEESALPGRGLSSVGWLPFPLAPDAAVGVGYAVVVVVGLVATSPSATGPVRALLAAPLALFLPGYAVLSALFPAGVEGARSWGESVRRDGLGFPDRVVLSFGTSLALLPVLAVVLSAVGLGLAPTVLAGAVGLVVLVGFLAGSVRRSRLPAGRRYRVPVAEWRATLHRGVLAADRPEAALNLALAATVVLSVATLGYALAAPPAAESYTNFQLLSGGPGGDPVAGDYPREFTAGQPRTVTVGIDNHEGATTTYTVVAQVQRVAPAEDGTGLRVVDRERVDRFSATLAPGERVRERRSVAPATTGEDLRLVYLLYRGDPPADPDRASAYRSVHVWIDVSGAEAAADEGPDTANGAA